MAIGITDNSQVTAGLGINLDHEALVALTGDPTKAGIVRTTTLAEQRARNDGSYQEAPSGTVTTGTLVKPSAVVPANDALTAGLCDSLGGRSWEALAAGLALDTDGILQAFRVPVDETRRLKISAVKLSASVQTVLVGGPFVSEFQLAFGFGGSTPTLQSAGPVRRVLLPELTQVTTAAQAVSTAVSQPFGSVAELPEPIFVNPGEWVALVVNRMGTAGSSGVLAYSIQYGYSWE